MKQSFITIHGIDGTGKTTTENKLVEELINMGKSAINFTNYKDSDNYPKNPFKKIEKGDNNLYEVCESYYKSMSHHSEQIQKLLSKGSFVVKARYIDDLRAHFSHLGVKEDFLNKCENIYSLIKPNLKIILTLDEEKRQQRINSREKIDEKDLDINRLEYFLEYLKKYNKNQTNTIFINTSENNVTEVIKNIINNIS